MQTMASLLNKIGLGSSSKSAEQHPDAQVFSFIPTSEDKTIVHVYNQGSEEKGLPLYSVKLSTKKSPDVSVWRGSDVNNEPFAKASVRKESCAATLMIADLTMHMETNLNYGSTSIEHPTFGTLKWKVGPLSGNPSTLCDGQGKELAKHKTVGLHYFGGPRELTMLVPPEEEFLDLIVLMVVVARRLSGIAMERIANTAAIVS